MTPVMRSPCCHISYAPPQSWCGGATDDRKVHQGKDVRENVGDHGRNGQRQSHVPRHGRPSGEYALAAPAAPGCSRGKGWQPLHQVTIRARDQRRPPRRVHGVALNGAVRTIRRVACKISSSRGRGLTLRVRPCPVRCAIYLGDAPGEPISPGAPATENRFSDTHTVSLSPTLRSFHAVAFPFT